MADHRSDSGVLGQSSRHDSADISGWELGTGGSGQDSRRGSHTLGITHVLLPLIGLLISSSGCRGSDARPTKEQSIMAGDTTQHVLSSDDRALVLRARELDRADSLDAARNAYEQGAQKLPNISDWL